MASRFMAATAHSLQHTCQAHHITAVIWVQAYDRASPYLNNAASTATPYLKAGARTATDIAQPALQQIQPLVQV